VRPKKQRLRKMSDEKTEAAKAEVHRLLELGQFHRTNRPPYVARQRSHGTKEKRQVAHVNRLHQPQ
jgi:hypothetical protein